jgi:hypothetical protein
MGLSCNSTRLVFFSIAAWFIVLPATRTADAESVWRQSTYEDFREGESDDGGVNLYAAADGTVRTIHTFDYNRDGANDILIISGHDNAYSPPTYIYLNDKTNGFDGRFRWLLLGNGAAAGAFTDLDGNGYQDAIICGTSNGANFAALDAIIYYGSEHGYATRTAVNLPTYQSKSVSVLDCNADGLPDLVFAQGDVPGLLIYFNSPQGFTPSNKREIDCAAVSHTVATDFDHDGSVDLAVLSDGRLLFFYSTESGLPDSPDLEVEVDGKGGRFVIEDMDRDGFCDLIVTNYRTSQYDPTQTEADRTDANAHIYWGDENNRYDSRPPTVLPGIASRDVAVADFNRDGLPDIALPEFGNDNATGDAPTTIFWGRPEGYGIEHTSRIETRFARSVKARDLDGDGWPDLVIACYRYDLSHNVDSYICYNQEGTFPPERRVPVQTLGAVNIAIGDADHDDRPDVMFLNVVDGTNGLTDSVIFWNDGEGRFGPDRTTMVEARDPFTHVASDFDLDGNLDIVFANSYEYARYREQGSYLYRGTGGGQPVWTPEHRSLLPTDFATGVVAGDFNHDGWLDLAFAQVGQSLDERVAHQSEVCRSPVYWGSAEGYGPDRVTWLPVENPRGLTTADLNRDGWLDLIYTNLTNDTVPVFWGSAEGFSSSRRYGLRVPGQGTVCINSADVNADGWLDLLFSCYYDYEAPTIRSDRYSYLFLGSPDGFDPDRRIDFQTMAPTQTAIADFDKDGRLDIFFPNYANSYKHRTWSSYLYYNGPDGFAQGRRTSLFTHSGSFGLALDFNADGWLDLAVGSHMQGNGNHRSNSSLFYGGPRGFSDYNKIQFPTFGSHELTSVDPGHIYHRRFEIAYTSGVHDAGGTVTVGPVSWEADTPHGSKIYLQVRCVDDRESLENAGWVDIDEEGGRAVSALKGRFIQYRAVFVSKDGSNYPVLHEVAVGLE